MILTGHNVLIFLLQLAFCIHILSVLSGLTFIYMNQAYLFFRALQSQMPLLLLKVFLVL